MKQIVLANYPPQQNNSDPTSLFAEILPDIPHVVDQVCHSLGYYPRQMEIEDLVQQVILLLIDRDYHNLRLFKHLSLPRTWLFAVVRHHLNRQIQRQNREVSLEDLQPDSLSFQPEQENKLLDEEISKQLAVALKGLTDRERQLFRLLCSDELSASEVALEMRIKTESVYQRRIAVIRKLRKMIHRESQD
jgi:RNA polymerase sigma factor (sigma-70 family)